MNIGIITIFPEMFSALEHSITGRAIEQGILQLDYYNPRDYSASKHRNVDDRPYGGGPGMVMMVQPLRDTIIAAKRKAAPSTRVAYVSPQGKPLDQAGISELAQRENLIIVAGRYEGIDERLITSHIDEEWSLGDYVISGGELAVMTMIDAITRLLPGALGHEESAQQDSFAQGLLDCPHYTRPEEIDGMAVPAELLTGNHETIRRWRLKQALGRTWQRRPDLLDKHSLSNEEQELLAEFIREHEIRS